METYVCHIIPTYLLDELVQCDDEEERRLASNTILEVGHVCAGRRDFFENKLARSRERVAYGEQSDSYEIVPDYVLDGVVASDENDQSIRDAAADTIEDNRQMRHQRAEALSTESTEAEVSTFGITPEITKRLVYDMEQQQIGDTNHDLTWQKLPGKLIRSEGEAAVKDRNVNEAYENCGIVLDFYSQIFDYHSVDNKNMDMISSVHYRSQYQNAAWRHVSKPDFKVNQMVYGDGGGSLHNFTACLDVVGHEMTHAVTQFNSMLQYKDESGALNEHISDVFGIMVKQWKEKTKARDSKWLLGEDCVMPGVNGIALRNMKFPGTAYKSGTLGTDPQPKHYSEIAAFTAKNEEMVKKDLGGVHIFSGIPNRAFALCAEAFGGFAWEKAGQIWWKVATTPGLISPKCTFIQFADETVKMTNQLFGRDDAVSVRNAWNTVGVQQDI